MMEQVQAEAEGLIHELGTAAFTAARTREHESSSEIMAQHWSRIASAIARMTDKQEQVSVNRPAQSHVGDSLPSASELAPPAAS